MRTCRGRLAVATTLRPCERVQPCGLSTRCRRELEIGAWIPDAYNHVSSSPPISDFASVPRLSLDACRCENFSWIIRICCNSFARALLHNCLQDDQPGQLTQRQTRVPRRTTGRLICQRTLRLPSWTPTWPLDLSVGHIGRLSSDACSLLEDMNRTAPTPAPPAMPYSKLLRAQGICPIFSRSRATSTLCSSAQPRRCKVGAHLLT
jgi:hypothetical protein